MALISTKGMYGLSAVYEIYNTQSLKPVAIRDIAENADIPQSYLEQILVALKKAKILKSTRGAYGGYTLAKDASDIKVKDVFSALEKKIAINETQTSSDVLNKFYTEYNQKLLELLDVSIAELHRKYKQKRTISYTTFGL